MARLHIFDFDDILDRICVRFFTGVSTVMIINTHRDSSSRGRSATSQQVIKDQNTMLLFNLIRRMAPISRAQLARWSGLSPATVSILAEELIANQWICETGPTLQRGERGRRPILLAVNAARGYVATVEILSHGYICTLYDICLNRIGSLRRHGSASAAGQICASLLELIDENHIDRSLLLGVHILFPGLFDAETGSLGFSAVIDENDMVQRNLTAYLQEQLPTVHVAVSNNATMVAYSEFTARAADTATPLLALTVHEGLSAGVVLDGQLCLPVEAGHIIIQRDGPLCRCGNRGCLETFCSTPALFREINRRTSLSLTYQDTFGADCNHAAMEQVAAAFHAGVPAVAAVLRDYARDLCCGIVSIVNLFAIRSVHIGGAVYALGEPFLKLLEETLRSGFHIVTNSRELKLRLFDDDYESSRKAAVMRTMEQIFQSD